jgi:hypothetical protein
MNVSKRLHRVSVFFYLHEEKGRSWEVTECQQRRKGGGDVFRCILGGVITSKVVKFVYVEVHVTEWLGVYGHGHIWGWQCLEYIWNATGSWLLTPISWWQGDFVLSETCLRTHLFLEDHVVPQALRGYILTVQVSHCHVTTCGSFWNCVFHEFMGRKRVTLAYCTECRSSNVPSAWSLLPWAWSVNVILD